MLKLLKSSAPARVEAKLLSASVKNGFLKRILNTNLCQVFIDVKKYTKNQ